jgi:hypothetical protein
MTYNIGDKVRIVNYGHVIYKWAGNGRMEAIDISPNLIGKEGVIDRQCDSNDDSYSIQGIGAWYHSDQLELVEANQVFKKEGV